MLVKKKKKIERFLRGFKREEDYNWSETGDCNKGKKEEVVTSHQLMNRSLRNYARKKSGTDKKSLKKCFGRSWQQRIVFVEIGKKEKYQGKE